MDLLCHVAVAVLAAALLAAAAAFALSGAERATPGGAIGDAGLILLRARWVVLVCAAVIALQYLVARLEGFPWSRRASKVNLQRKVQHVATGATIVALAAVLPPELSTLALGAAVAAFLLVQAARCHNPEVNQQFLAAFGPMLKDAERVGVRPPGAFYFLLGCFLSLLCFPRSLAVFCMLSVTVADPLAAAGGAFLGGPRLFGDKTLGGFLACCSAGTAVASGMALIGGVGRGASSPIASIFQWLACGLASGVSELLGGRWPHLDDNLTSSFGAGLILRSLDVGLSLAGVQSPLIICLG
mmetsp:Transcript_111272/g.314070  ORF Transcript_111272/g.314070 Transcript_111272/m.314070 type:complete len:299 (+) Transcript_111272:27-923(+)